MVLRLKPDTSQAVHVLSLEGVSRTFGSLVALNQVSLNVSAGERRAVLGANGAGKTTLLNAITGDFPPTSGCVRLFGEDVTNLAPYERIRRGLRRTYQSSLLFGNLSVIDNIFLAVRGVLPGRMSFRRSPSSDPTRTAAEQLLQDVHLDAQKDTRVSDLSHGQQRQLEIGMALAGRPRLLLLDEPAAGLSPGERGGLVEILQALPQDIGYIIIEHDLDVAFKVANYVTVMHEGSVFKEGTLDEIRNDAGVEQIYLGKRHG